MVSLPIFAVATIFASTSVIGTGARSPSAAEICANDAAWADDDAGGDEEGDRREAEPRAEARQQAAQEEGDPQDDQLASHQDPRAR